MDIFRQRQINMILLFKSGIFEILENEVSHGSEPGVWVDGIKKKKWISTDIRILFHRIFNDTINGEHVFLTSLMCCNRVTACVVTFLLYNFRRRNT